MSVLSTGPRAIARPGELAGPGLEPRARVRRAHDGLVLLFAGVLLFFPSEVALAGPLRSNGAPARLIGLGLATLLVLDLLRPRRHRAPARAEPIVVLLLVYLAGQLFFFGYRTMALAEPTGVLRDLLFSVAACGAALFIAVRVRTQASVHRVLGVLVGGCTLSAVVALAQAIGSPPSWADLVTFPGFDQVAPVTGGGDRFGLKRVVGTASHPIEFGVVLGSCLPLALHLVLHARSRRARLWAAAASATMALALPFALSRGGLVCIAGATLVFLVVQPWGVRITTAAAGVVAGCAAFVLAPNLASALVRLFADSGDDISIEGRTNDFPLVDAAFNAAPWLGGAPLEVDWLDNQWFILLTQRGLVGMALFSLLIALPLAGLLATAWRVRRLDPSRQSLAAALAGGIVAIAISGGVFDLMSFGQAALLLFLLVGLSAPVLVTPDQAVQATSRHDANVTLSTGDEPAQSVSARSTVTGSPEPSIVLPLANDSDDGVSTGP